MARWMRFEADGHEGFGTVEGDHVSVHTGDMFGGAQPTGQSLPLAGLRVLPPCRPTKMVALWNNFRALGAKLGQEPPAEPLWFLKASSCFEGQDAVVHRPRGYTGRVVFEGELGIVLGRQCRGATAEEAAAAIFGYTCIDDLTAVDILTRDPSFPQWARAKSCDGFGPFGPVIATGLDPSALVVRTVVNGAERQSYPISDMVFPAATIVQMISQELTLEPGDVICCGTSVGAGSLKGERSVVEVSIEGIGTLRTTYLDG